MPLKYGPLRPHSARVPAAFKALRNKIAKRRLTRINPLHIWPLTDAALPVSTGSDRFGRQHRTDSLSPGHKSGSNHCPPLMLVGSLTSSVFDEGTCGRRRPVRGPQGSGNRLFKPTTTLSLVSITFDSAGNRLLAVHASRVGPGFNPGCR